MKAILLNGPPRSGKDTIGGILAKAIPGAVLRKFALPIVVFMKNEFGIDMAAVEKDEPHPHLLGQTPRQVAIQYSEGFCKPLWGDHFFGAMAARLLKKEFTREHVSRAGGVQMVDRVVDLGKDTVAIFTDSGFASEAFALSQDMPCLQVMLKRPGCSFEGDSRSYWIEEGIEQMTFDNDVIGLDYLMKKVQRNLVPTLTEWLAK